MYLPSHFQESNVTALHTLMREYPLGMLVTLENGALNANHIPFELDETAGKLGRLRAHVARANPVWQHVNNGDEVLVVFRGAEAYISPNWYPSKHTHHRQVPTWNYMVAHAYGQITVHDDERYVRSVVAHLTRRHEAAEPVPWKMSDSTPAFIDSMLSAIVGLEIDIARLEGKFKLSQNKEIQDIRSAGSTVQDRGAIALGTAMLACANAKACGTGTPD